MTLGRSPEFCLKPLIYMYLLKTDHAPGELLVGPFLSQGSIFSKSKYSPLGDATYLDLVVSNKRIFMFSICKSM